MSTINNEEKILALLTNIQADVGNIKDDMRALKATVEEGFRATRSELVDAVECVGKKVDQLDQSFKDVETVTAQNAYDVQLIKRRA